MPHDTVHDLPPPPEFPRPPPVPRDHSSWIKRLATAGSAGEALLKIGAVVVLVGGAVGSLVWSYADHHGVSTDAERKIAIMKMQAPIDELKAANKRCEERTSALAARIELLEKAHEELVQHLLYERE